MINNFSTGKWARLRQKQQDVHFINQLQAGMNCSAFEAKAILNSVYEVYQPYFDNSASMKPGQILFEVVSVGNSAREKLSGCQLETVVLTLDGGENLEVREKGGVAGLRRHRLERISIEAFQQVASSRWKTSRTVCSTVGASKADNYNPGGHGATYINSL